MYVIIIRACVFTCVSLALYLFFQIYCIGNFFTANELNCELMLIFMENISMFYHSENKVGICL